MNASGRAAISARRASRSIQRTSITSDGFGVTARSGAGLAGEEVDAFVLDQPAADIGAVLHPVARRQR